MGRSDFLGEFREEAGFHLRVLRDRLGQLEGGAFDAEAVQEMVISAHTIKGGAATLELEEIRELAAALEVSLRSLRDGRRAPSPPWWGEMARAVEALEELVPSATPGSAPTGAARSLAEGLRRWVGEGGQEGRAAESRPAGPPDRAERSVSGPKRVLLIDDSALIRQMVKRSLEQLAGHRVLVASSGQEGLALAAAERPDAILLDAMMPGMDGMAVFRRLRSSEGTRAIPVVFLSAAGDSEELGEMVARGEARLIPKPFDFKQLPGQVAAALGWG